MTYFLLFWCACVVIEAHYLMQEDQIPDAVKLAFRVAPVIMFLVLFVALVVTGPLWLIVRIIGKIAQWVRTMRARRACKKLIPELEVILKAMAEDKQP